MMYPFMTLDDKTEIVHSKMRADGSVKVYMERPDEMDCFHCATCYLPMYKWENISGFSVEDIKRLRYVIESVEAEIMRYSKELNTTHG